jgi:hypothetical protein
MYWQEPDDEDRVLAAEPVRAALLPVAEAVAAAPAARWWATPVAAGRQQYVEVTAGRAVPVDDAGTVLAGWDPDLTYWLTDTLTLAGPATDWVRLDQEPLGWSQERDQRN